MLQFVGVFLWDKGSDQKISLISPWMENGNLTQYLKKYPDADKMPFVCWVSFQGVPFAETLVDLGYQPWPRISPYI